MIIPGRQMEYRHAVVRDLAWVIQSPTLLDPIDYPMFVPGVLHTDRSCQVVDDAYCNHLMQQHHAWLSLLDNDPTSLQQWLVERSSHRLGYYFESLVEYWLRHIYQNGFVATHIQVQQGKQTIGEYDFLFAEPQASLLQHWEVAVKFYLYHQSDEGIERWYGPMTRDRLDLKLTHMVRHQIALSQTSEGRNRITQLGYQQVKSSLFLKGYLFYPSHAEWSSAPHHNPGLAKGHLRGWWTHIDKLNIPQQRVESRWMIIPRLRWLSPLVIETPDVEEMLTVQALGRCCQELLAKRPDPLLLAELVPVDGRWCEVTRGFVVGSGWPAVSGRPGF